jgi:precorrin-6Y C5,15-methyltransferase (decarboxylating)
MIRRNAGRLAVAHGLAIVAGDARETIAAADGRPDAVFFGGGVAEEALFEMCWRALAPGGVFVSNAVTLEGEAATLARRRRLGGTLVRIEIAVSEPVGGLIALKPRMPVLQWRAQKAAP